jgi:hypothetical protein
MLRDRATIGTPEPAGVLGLALAVAGISITCEGLYKKMKRLGIG